MRKYEGISVYMEISNPYHLLQHALNTCDKELPITAFYIKYHYFELLFSLSVNKSRFYPQVYKIAAFCHGILPFFQPYTVSQETFSLHNPKNENENIDSQSLKEFKSFSTLCSCWSKSLQEQTVRAKSGRCLLDLLGSRIVRLLSGFFLAHSRLRYTDLLSENAYQHVTKRNQTS